MTNVYELWPFELVHIVAINYVHWMKQLLEANMTRNYGHKIKLYEHWSTLEPGVLPYMHLVYFNISIFCISSNHDFWWPHYIQASCKIVHMTYLCFHFENMSPKENSTTSYTPSEKILYALMDAYSLSQSSHSTVIRWSIERKQLKA